MKMSTAVLQSRAALEQAQQNKQHIARVNEALARIYATARFNGKLIKPSQAANAAILQMCAEYHRRDGIAVTAATVVPTIETLQEVWLRQRSYWWQVFTPEMF